MQIDRLSLRPKLVEEASDLLAASEIDERTGVKLQQSVPACTLPLWLQLRQSVRIKPHNLRERKSAIHPHEKEKTNTQLVESRLDPSSGKCFPAGSKFRVVFMVVAHSCSKLRRQTLNYSDVRHSRLHLFCIYSVPYCLHCEMTFAVSPRMSVYLYKANSLK